MTNIISDGINGEYNICIEKYKSPVVTSICFKNIGDNVFKTTSVIFRNASACQSSKVIHFNHIFTNHSVSQLASSTKHFTSNCKKNKQKNTGVNNSKIMFTSMPSTIRDTSTKINIFSDMQLKKYQKNENYKKRTCKFFKSKNNTLYKSIYHKRINLEGQRKVDFMYYLAKRHNFFSVTEKIFSYLYGKDIITMSLVSKIWFNTVKYSPTAKLMKESFLLYMESNKENHECIQNQGRLVHLAQNHSFFMSRRYLSDIGNIMLSMTNHRHQLVHSNQFILLNMKSKII